MLAQSFALQPNRCTSHLDPSPSPHLNLLPSPRRVSSRGRSCSVAPRHPRGYPQTIKCTLPNAPGTTNSHRVHFPPPVHPHPQPPPQALRHRRISAHVAPLRLRAPGSPDRSPQRAGRRQVLHATTSGSAESSSPESSGVPGVPLLPSSPGGFLTAVANGLAVAVGGLVFSISFSSLIFSGPGAPDGALGEGVGIMLWSGLIAAWGMASFSSLPAIGEPQDGPSALLGIMAIQIFADGGDEMVQALPEAARLPTLEATIAVTTLATGLTMLTIGRLNLGNAVRFLPSPVLGGFLAGTGWVLLVGSAKVMTDIPLDADFAQTILATPAKLWYELVPGVMWGLGLTYTNRAVQQGWVVPTFLAAGCAVWFGAAALTGVGPMDASDLGLLVGPFPEGGISFQPLVMRMDQLSQVDWMEVGHQGSRIATIVALSVIGMLLNTSALEVCLQRDAVIERELQAVGWLNVANALGGGVLGYHGVSSSRLAAGGGTPTRTPGFVVGLCYLGLLLLPQLMDVVGFLPRAIIGGLLVFLGVSFLVEWVVEGATSLPRIDYAIVLAILVTVASFGYLAGVVVGIAAAVCVFVADYSRVSIVRSSFDLGDTSQPVSSTLPRTPQQRAVITGCGQAFGLVLQGFVFFGTAYSLVERIKRRHRESEGGLRYLILDFRYVVGVDGSAITCFEKILNFAAQEGITLVLTDCAQGQGRGMGRVVRAVRNTTNTRTPSGLLEPQPSGTSLFGSGLRLQRMDGDDPLPEDPQVVGPNVLSTKTLDSGLRLVEERILAEWTKRFPSAKNAVVESCMDFEALVGAVCRTAAEEEAFRSGWQLVTFNQGDTVCKKGDVADRIYFVASGSLMATLPGGVDIAIGNNDFLGAVGFYRTSGFGTVRFADVKVAESGQGLMLESRRLAVLESEEPHAAARFHRVMAGHLADTIIARNKVITQYYKDPSSDSPKPEEASPEA